MKKRINILIFNFILISVLYIIDRLPKHYVLTNLKNRPSLPIIKGFLEISYSTNPNSSFNLITQETNYITFAMIIILGLIIVGIVKTTENGKITFINIILSVASAGITANLFDRIKFGYIINYINIYRNNIPVFNIADIYITISCLLFILILIFRCPNNKNIL